jgi:hypothetical protein
MAEVKIPEKRSAIEKIMQGLQVAQAVYGVKSAYDQNKLNQMKMEEYEKEQERKKRQELGDFTEEEASNLYRVEPSTKGSSVGWINKIERTPSGKVIYDTETMQPKTVREKFYYITKDRAQIQSYIDKQSEAAQRLEDMNVRAQGGVTKTDILSGKIRGTTKYKDGYVKTFFYEPETQTKQDFWVDPTDLRTLRGTAVGGKEPSKAEPPKGISPSLKSGFYAAQEAGIENPTIKQMEEHSPEFVDKKITEYKKGIEDVDIELYDALQNIDNAFGIDYSVVQGGVGGKEKPIEGVTTTGSWLPTTGLAGGVGRAVVGKEGASNKAAVQGLTNVLLKIRSGAAITQQEAENFKAEISAAMGANDPVALRNAIARIRGKLEAKVTKLELNFPKSVKDIIYGDDRLPSTKSSLFQKKKELSDEAAADLFMGGK